MFIEKDGTILNVTRGAYLSLFEAQGWVPASKSTLNKKQQKSDIFLAPQPSKKESKKPEEDASEIPFANMLNGYEDENDEDYEVVLDDMTIKELIEFAAEKDLDIEGLTKKSQIIKAIKEQLGE